MQASIALSGSARASTLCFLLDTQPESGVEHAFPRLNDGGKFVCNARVSQCSPSLENRSSDNVTHGQSSLRSRISAALSTFAKHADSSFITENSILQRVDCDYCTCLTAHSQSCRADR